MSCKKQSVEPPDEPVKKKYNAMESVTGTSFLPDSTRDSSDIFFLNDGFFSSIGAQDTFKQRVSDRLIRVGFKDPDTTRLLGSAIINNFEAYIGDQVVRKGWDYTDPDSLTFVFTNIPPIDFTLTFPMIPIMNFDLSAVKEPVSSSKDLVLTYSNPLSATDSDNIDYSLAAHGIGESGDSGFFLSSSFHVKGKVVIPLKELAKLPKGIPLTIGFMRWYYRPSLLQGYRIAYFSRTYQGIKFTLKD